jgi:hypothetical protein
MRKPLLALVALALLAAAPAPAAAQQGALELTLEEWCALPGGEPTYGVTVTVTGPPDTSFEGRLSFAGGVTYGPAIFSTGPTGVFEISLGESEPVASVTAAIRYDGIEQVETLERPCQAPPAPTTAEDCKNGGWRNYPGFKNQGQCVAFAVKQRPHAA